VVKEFNDSLRESKDMAVAVAAIRALTSVIRNSNALTMMGLEKELKDAALALQRYSIAFCLTIPCLMSYQSTDDRRCNPTAISLKAACELFLRYTTRTSALEMENFPTAKARLIEVCNYVYDQTIALVN
jgi:translation initiation factor eIF-2B subunit alpha